MDDHKYFNERHDPTRAPKPLSRERARAHISESVHHAWVTVERIAGEKMLAFWLLTEVGIENTKWTFLAFTSQLDDLDYFALLEFIWRRTEDEAGQRLVDGFNEAFVHYGNGYKFDNVGNIVSIGTPGVAEALERRAPSSETESNRHKLDDAVRLFRRAGATRQNKKDALERLGEIIEWHKQDFDKVVPKKEKDRLGEFLNGFSIRHHGKDQEDEYPDAWLEWMFVRALATVHLYWDLKAPAGQG